MYCPSDNGSALVTSSGNPDPAKYDILAVEEIGRYLILKVRYPDCTNFEGVKILVYKDVTAIDLLKQKLIDPHFSNELKFKSPVARFVPTEEGYSMARHFAKSCTK